MYYVASTVDMVVSGIDVGQTIFFNDEVTQHIIVQGPVPAWVKNFIGNKYDPVKSAVIV